MLSQQPTFADSQRAAALGVDAVPVSSPLQQKANLWDRHVRRRYGWLKLIKGSLGVLLGEHLCEQRVILGQHDV
jgi:hypothetical protein